jgi:MFS family permease
VAKIGTARAVGPAYPWFLVGLLWFCGFFNYADRQALYAVLPKIQAEFGLNDTQTGVIGWSFMVVYAVTSPFAGNVVDAAPRRVLITVGLAFWSLICAATATARSFVQLVVYRAAEGLGESCYFPASMSILADYHAPTTRSRAMSIHQTSVYLGTAGGGLLAGYLADLHGWRAPFLFLGLVGAAYAAWLWTQVVEPVRGADRAKPTPELAELPPEPADATTFWGGIWEVLSTPTAALLLVVFIGANFVATAFLTWLPMFIYRKFGLSLTGSSLTSTAWPLASLVGALAGGYLADLAARRPGGRIRVQAIGLLCGAPFVLATDLAGTLALTVAALIGVGFCKGLYDANIFASLYDVVRPPLRGTAAGLMNAVGWTGGSLGALAVGALSDHFGLGVAITSTAAFYVAAGLLGLLAAALAASGASPSAR